MNRRLGPRIAVVVAVLAVVAGAVGVVVTLILNAFVYDEFDAYGEIPVPGSGQLALPTGEVTISFHTVVAGGSDGGFPVPPLRLGLRPVEGGPDPVVTRTTSSVTSVNNDVRVRIWVAQIPRDDVYAVETGGTVGGYIKPRLAFGRDTSSAVLPWAFGAVLGAGLIGLAPALMWSARTARRVQPLRGPVSLDEQNWPGPLPPPVTSYQSTDHGVRLEQLKTLAALRDSGALTDAEFETEKRRILGS